MFKGPYAILIALLVLTVAVVSYRAHQDFLAGNYSIIANTACDPETEACFAPEDPESLLSIQEQYYKKIEIRAHEAPPCLEEHTCADFSCSGRASCTVTYCSTDTVESGEVCTTSD